MRVDFSHLKGHKFRRNFADTLNPLSLETERWDDFFLRSLNYIRRIILCGNCKFKDNFNKQAFIATIQFIKNSDRFNQSQGLFVFLLYRNNKGMFLYYLGFILFYFRWCLLWICQPCNWFMEKNSMFYLSIHDSLLGCDDNP